MLNMCTNPERENPARPYPLPRGNEEVIRQALVLQEAADGTFIPEHPSFPLLDALWHVTYEGVTGPHAILQEAADGTLIPENPSILELEARADRMALGEEAQAVKDFQRRLDYNMRKVRRRRPTVSEEM